MLSGCKFFADNLMLVDKIVVKLQLMTMPTFITKTMNIHQKNNLVFKLKTRKCFVVLHLSTDKNSYVHQLQHKIHSHCQQKRLKTHMIQERINAGKIILKNDTRQEKVFLFLPFHLSRLHAICSTIYKIDYQVI